MPDRVAILLDGGFVKKKLAKRLRSFPSSQDVLALCGRIMQHQRLAGSELFRVYYYDAPPLGGSATNPIDGKVINLAETRQAEQNRSLIDSLELQPDFAVRRGSLMQVGWKLGSGALKSLKRSPSRSLTAQDFVPDIQQKGVDMRIGLDIATMALKRVVQILVLVVGDSDFVPPMKFARTEGLKIYLEAMGHGVRRELRAHADLVL